MITFKSGDVTDKGGSLSNFIADSFPLKAVCCFKGSKSEGWYAIDDCKNADPSINLIEWAQCEPGEYALLCNQSSDIFAKFTQELKKGTQAPPERNTSINWIVYMPPQGLTENNTEELLNSGLPLDYVAYWDPEKQLQFGSARGNTTYQGSFDFLLRLLNKLLPGQYLDYVKNGAVFGGNPGPGDIVITGPFDLEFGKPYFISATYDFDRWTWVGKVPERVTFELKYGPENSAHENYIVLPLDTTIKKASQLCDIRDENGNQILDQNPYTGFIEWWDPLQQRRVTSTRSCSYIIQYPQFDFDIEPGKVYLIFVQRDAVWEQI